MNCLPFEERIAQYVDDGLDLGETRLVEEHLRNCPACAEFAAQLAADRRLLQALPPESADVDFAAMRRQIRGAILRERRTSRIVPVLLVAASILVAVAAAILYLRQTAPLPAPAVASHVLPPAPPAPEIAPVVRQAVSPAKHRIARKPSTPPTTQPDPALEAALQKFLSAEKAPALSSHTSPAEIRIATRDPNVILILVQETNGASNE